MAASGEPPAMNLNKRLSTLFLASLLVVLGVGCQSKVRKQTRDSARDLPPVILWAWERPENLEFLDSQRFGVAFLAQTLTLTADDVILSPRHQPLKVAPSTGCSLSGLISTVALAR